MGLITRFYGPNAKGSKLTIKEMDDNLYYLQSFGVSGVTYQNNVLTFTNPTGGTNSITINDFYTTGATYNNGLIYFDRNDQLSAYTVNISSITGNTNTSLTVGTTQISNGGNGRILFQSGTSLQQDNSLFWDNTNKRLGVGTTNPTNKMVVSQSVGATSGTTTLSGVETVVNPFINSTQGIFVYKNDGSIRGFKLVQNGSNDSNSTFKIISSNAGVDVDRFVIRRDNGNVGIGTNSPTSKLDVNGKTKTTNFQMTSGATNGYVLTSDVSGNASWQLSNSFTGGTVNGPTNFTNGLTANILSATTYQNLPQDIFVTGGTYTNGEILFKNNSGGSFTVTGLPIGGAGGEIYYFNLSQTQTPYREFSPISVNGVEQTTGITINSGVTSTITSFLTPTGYPNTTTIPAGYWSFYIHSYKDTINASFNVFCEVYLRTTGGSETLILTTEGYDIQTYNPTVSMQLTDGYYSGGTIDVSDRILVKVRATNTGLQTNTITFFTEGQQHYSYGITPFSNFNALRCDTLSGCTTIINLENNKVNKNGDTMTGTLILPTISATTYQNLPVNPDTYVTGFTYSNNKFTIKQNNGQSNLSQIINTVTGFTVNGGLTTTTATVTNRTGTPSQVASFDTSGKLVAGVGTLGQTTYSVYGTSTLTITNATVGYQLIPGLTQTITVPNNCSVYVFTSGGVQNSNGTSTSFTVDVALFVDGVGPQTNGSFRRVTTTNPNTVNFAWTSALWSMGALLNLSVGNHTIDVRSIYRNTSNTAVSALISSDLTLNRQGELYIMIIKN